MPLARITRPCLYPIAVLVFLTSGISQSGKLSEESDFKENPNAREEWFYKQRALPFDTIPAGARLRAIEQLERMRGKERERKRVLKQSATMAATTSEMLALAATEAQWSSIGPRPITATSGTIWSGRATSIAVDPRNPQVAYIGGAEGGVWKTTDGGGSWRPLTDQQPSLATASIVLDPNNPDVIYVGTGEEPALPNTYYGAGILKSSDGGTSWQHIPAFGNHTTFEDGARVGGLAIQPTNSQVLLAAVRPGGIFRSTNGGATWTKVLACSWSNDVEFQPANGSIAYGTCADSPNLYKSVDGGLTWSVIGSSVFKNWHRVELAIAPSQPSRIYALATELGAALFRSDDAGNSWVQMQAIDGSYCQPQCTFNQTLAVHPTNPDIIFLGGIELLRSLDGGVTWRNVRTGSDGIPMHPDFHALAFSPAGDSLYVGNDGGAYAGTNLLADAPSWRNLNATLELTQFYPGISLHPSDPSIMFGGTQDNGLLRFRAGTWQNLLCGDSFYTVIDPTDPLRVYASCYPGFVARSTDGGNLWFPKRFGDSQSAFVTGLVMDPSNPQRLYILDNALYRTENGGDQWQRVESPFGVTVFAVAPSNSNVAYLALGGSPTHLYVSQNVLAGAAPAWTERTAGLPTRIINQIVVGPNDSNIAYVAFSGFSGRAATDTGGHIFKTVNAGTTWIDVSGNLPNVPVNQIELDPDQANTIYAATDVGVFYTTDGGASWNTLVSGLPRVVVQGLKLHRPTRILRAATYGRGMWEVQLPPPQAGDACPVPSAAGVNICKPADGATLNSPVQFSASATSIDPATPIKAMKLYVNGAGIFTSTGSQLQTMQTLAPGAYRIVIKGWDTAERSVSRTINITVSGSSSSCSASAVGLTLCSPPDGATVSSPVRITAAAKAATGAAITTMKVYLDGTSKFTASSSSFDTSLAMSAGAHRITVKAWEDGGTVYAKTVNITVPGGSTCTASSVGLTLCAPNDGATVNSPVRIAAAARAASGTSITTMKVYVDGTSKFTASSSSFDTSLAMSAGAHRITVKAWEKDGTVYAKTVNITVQ